MEQPENNQNNNRDALTCIRDTYTLYTTPDVEDIMTRHFLETLAVAAHRTAQPDKGANSCEP